MPQTGEARAWWADVEHVRETIERRREAERRLTAARAERHLTVVGDRDGAAGRTTGAGHRTTGAGRPGTGHDAERRRVERRRGERRQGAVASAAGERRMGERRGSHEAAPRRTIEITGRTVPAPAVPRAAGDDTTIPFGARGSRRRPSLHPADRLVHRPDRIAMWAVVMGFVLILVAATSA